MTATLLLAAIIAGALLLGAAALHLLPRLGAGGRRLSESLCDAPALDWLIFYFTIAPLIAGPVALSVELGAWPGVPLGLLGGVLGQVAALLIWTWTHELAHPQARRGPRIVSQINRTVGPVRNHAAVWTTALAVPLFWFVRMGEVFIYPPLTWLVRLPKYDSRDWVNVSRHKFSGLVGHDLIWCLYCDWMTGIWSLGSEMLRNVESFWCPIRFHSEKKCANCAIDFPDVVEGWVPADGTMADVVGVLEQRYPGPEANSWYAHPTRLTVEGEPPQTPIVSDASTTESAGR